MPDSSHQTRSLILGPALCAVLLGAMTLQGRNYRTEADFEAFHRTAADEINKLPLVIAPWMGREQPLSDEERQLLQPNAYRCVAYSDTRASALADASRVVLLMVSQCKRANNMSGHYPPICYPNRGYIQTGEQSRDWVVNGLKITGMEYQFERRDRGRSVRTTIYNFMVLPEQGISRDMKAVYASAEDYEQRYYGVAQFQVVFGGTLADKSDDARRERDGIFAELIGPCTGVIRTLADGVPQ